MLTDDNKNITSTVCVGQFFAFSQSNDVVSVVDQLVALLDKKLLICTFTFHALWSLEHCVPSDQWSDKQHYYTNSL